MYHLNIRLYSKGIYDMLLKSRFTQHYLQAISSYAPRPVILQPNFHTPTSIHPPILHYASFAAFDNNSEKFQMKHKLFLNIHEPLMVILNQCSSMQDVLNFINKYASIMKPMHITQCVLLLWDLQYIYQFIMNANAGNAESNSRLTLMQQAEFDVLLELVEQNLKEFDPDLLTYVYMYLNKLGVDKNKDMMQKIFTELAVRVQGNSSLLTISQFALCANVHYAMDDVNIFNSCQHLLPTIEKQIENCAQASDLKLISICLNILHSNISADLLKKYMQKVELMISKQLLANDTEALIRIILFLHYPSWRHNCAPILIKCVSLLQSKIMSLSMSDVLILNEVLLKMQEPANVLFDIQRCNTKFLAQLEADQHPDFLTRLRFVNAIVQFSPPHQRYASELIVRKYSNYPLNGVCLLELLKAMCYIKMMDPAFCKTFWNQMLVQMEHDEHFRREYLLKVCTAYLTYNLSMPYRCFQLEKRLNHWMEELIETGRVQENPTLLATIACYIIPYGNDVSIVNYVASKFSERASLFGPLDCVSVSKSLLAGRVLTKNVHLKDKYRDLFGSACNEIASAFIQPDGAAIDINTNNMLIKSFTYRNNADNKLVNSLLRAYNPDTYMSSVLVKNLTNVLSSTSALLPDMLDKMVEYVCTFREAVTAFNAEKVAFLCYQLGYLPRQYETFATVLVDLILRDQERINGLCFIQSCIALCFFNRMSSALVKLVFNVNFMERIDNELKHCYSIDIYPKRMRNKLMQLNRAVCIDYPQLNIPWFHQKLVAQPKVANHVELNVFQNVEHYLLKILYDTEVETNFITPYGYHIDFLVQFLDDADQRVKIAVLLAKPKDFTRIVRQLKGEFQTKIRHLEILGYRVKVLPCDTWNNLIYGEEKVAYITALLNLPSRYSNFYYQTIS